jgi:hypothetical protein
MAKSMAKSMTETHPLQRLLDYTEKYRQKIWLASLYSISNKLLDLAPPALIGALMWWYKNKIRRSLSWELPIFLASF